MFWEWSWWKGDVKTMLLSVGELLSLGWKASLSGEEVVRLTVVSFWGL